MTLCAASVKQSLLWKQPRKGGSRLRWNEACKLLAPVYGWFSEGFDTRDLKEAKDLLGVLTAPTR
jgi:hypothetical protein